MAASSSGPDRRRSLPRIPLDNLKLFTVKTYHPIQSGSIDGTDTAPHDRGIKRAMVARKRGLYDPFEDDKMVGEPTRTLFIGHLAPQTTEDELKEEMEKFGRVRSIRLVRDIVTGASRRYAFVEFETHRGMWRAYREKEVILHDSKLLVEWNRQRLMPGWLPRRYGGGLGGVKEGGQLRFGGRARLFRAPLREIPVEELERKGIPVPDKRDYQGFWDLPPLPEAMVEAVRQEQREEERRREVELEEREASHRKRRRERHRDGERSSERSSR